MTQRAAAFVDRDGTIIRDASYIADPQDLELLPGAADAIRRLRSENLDGRSQDRADDGTDALCARRRVTGP